MLIAPRWREIYSLLKSLKDMFDVQGKSDALVSTLEVKYRGYIIGDQHVIAH